MTFQEIIHRALRDQVSSSRKAKLRTLSRGLPLLPSLPMGKAHRCRVCGAPTNADSDVCSECRVPFSVRLADLRMLCESRTCGRWRAGENWDTVILRADRVVEDYGPDHQLIADDLLPHDARWIAAAANVLPELLTEYDRLREENAALRKGQTSCCQPS